jgi:hypothetical protein
VRNKLRRLAEFIQEGFPEKIVEVFKFDADEEQALAKQLAMISKAIAFHQHRAGELWLQAGKKRTTEERRVSAQAELASFVFAYLNGEAGDHAESTLEAMRSLGRENEVNIVKSLSRR